MTIVFLCPHAAAKSVMAAALFNREAQAQGLSIRARCAGTDPDPAAMPEVVALLAREGIDVSAHQPRGVTEADLVGAIRIVSMGCDVEHLMPSGEAVIDWGDVPLPSQDLAGARRLIGARIAAMVRQLLAEQG